MRKDLVGVSLAWDLQEGVSRICQWAQISRQKILACHRQEVIILDKPLKWISSVTVEKGSVSAMFNICFLHSHTPSLLSCTPSSPATHIQETLTTPNHKPSTPTRPVDSIHHLLAWLPLYSSLTHHQPITPHKTPFTTFHHMHSRCSLPQVTTMWCVCCCPVPTPPPPPHTHPTPVAYHSCESIPYLAS